MLKLITLSAIYFISIASIIYTKIMLVISIARHIVHTEPVEFIYLHLMIAGYIVLFAMLILSYSIAAHHKETHTKILEEKHRNRGLKSGFHTRLDQATEARKNRKTQTQKP